MGPGENQVNEACLKQRRKIKHSTQGVWGLTPKTGAVTNQLFQGKGKNSRFEGKKIRGFCEGNMKEKKIICEETLDSFLSKYKAVRDRVEGLANGGGSGVMRVRERERGGTLHAKGEHQLGTKGGSMGVNHRVKGKQRQGTVKNQRGRGVKRQRV